MYIPGLHFLSSAGAWAVVFLLVAPIVEGESGPPSDAASVTRPGARLQIAPGKTGFLPNLDRLLQYGPGSVIRYRSTWSLPEDWLDKRWGLRLTGGNLPASGVTVDVYHRVRGVNRSLQQAWDDGLFLDRRARSVVVTISPIDTWNLSSSTYRLAVTANGVVRQELGAFALGDTSCLILNGSGELRNTAVTFVGDSKERSVPGFTDAEWEDYLYSGLRAPQGIYRFTDDPMIDNYRDRINVQAIRTLHELSCESGRGAGTTFDCVASTAESIVASQCPQDESRDPTVAIVARPPEGQDDWDDGWRAHADSVELTFGPRVWPNVFGVEDLVDRIFVTQSDPGNVVLHELGHAFGRLPDYYRLYKKDDPNRCSEHPSRMCSSSRPFKDLLKSREKARMVHFINRNSCDVRRIELGGPLGNPSAPNGKDACARFEFYVDYESPSASPCFLNFALADEAGRIVWTATTFEALPANPLRDGRRIPYVLGYAEDPNLVSERSSCASDPAHCSKAPGFAGLDDQGQSAPSGVYVLHAYASESVTASTKFTWRAHEATQGCLPPGANANSLTGSDYSVNPVLWSEDNVERLTIPRDPVSHP